MDIFLSAIALVLVLEGIFPAVSPSKWRHMMMQFSRSNEKTIRIVGLVCMVIGALILYIIHGL